MLWLLAGVIALGAIAALVYWLLVITEGVYLGRQAVVWMYDRTAHTYDGIKEFDAQAEALFVIRPLLHRLRHVPAPRVLDVATGTGRLPHFLLQEPRFQGRVVGLDAAQKMLAIAAEKLAGYAYRAPLVQGTAVPLPFPAHSFDAVTCLEALEFFPDDRAALREMVRVLRPGGVLLTTRRRGWEAWTFVGRYRSEQGLSEFLRGLGLVEVQIRPWQVDYDQVFAYKAGVTEQQSP